MGAEDFSLYLQQAPGTMFRLGVGSPHLLNPPLHHPEFLVDESAILTGVITLATRPINIGKGKIKWVGGLNIR